MNSAFALKTKTVHQTLAASVTVRKRFEYDHAGRLLKTYQQNNSDSEILLSSLAYNELGQLITKNLHSTNGGSTFLQSVDTPQYQWLAFVFPALEKTPEKTRSSL